MSKKIESTQNLESTELGGIYARQGFTFQDHVAAGYCLEMLDNENLLEVWCEVLDDITLIWEQDRDNIYEFVQVKSNQLNQLWSIAKLCDKETEILQKSLANDCIKEQVNFRIVTSRPPNDELSVLGDHLANNRPVKISERLQSLIESIQEKLPDIKSPNGHGVDFWVARAAWDAKHNLESLLNSNLNLLHRLIENRMQLPLFDRSNDVYQSLLQIVRAAAEALPDQLDQKKILSADLSQWFEQTLKNPRKSELLKLNQLNLLVNQEEIVEGLAKLAIGLTSRKVRDEKWIDRPELTKIQEVENDQENPVICLLGSPGSGKTSLLAKLTNDSLEQGIQVLALKADLLPKKMTLDDWAKEQTGVDLPLKQVISYLANDQRIIVVVDQLDALADLVDLSSDRLNQFLDLIQWCAKQKNVSVICSCRNLEFHHDTRFSSLDAECIQLELPTWEQISDELNREGIENSASWSDEFREVLRTPQHLKIFLDQYRDTGTQDVFSSYQLMLDKLWERKVTKPEQRDLLDQLTEHFIQEESIWSSTVQFESHASTIRELESVGILKRDGARISFSHQTLLEHAKARLFTKTGQSLCNYVLERQDAIYVRPTIWSVLGYLRDADRSKYLLELEALLNADIRLHI